jgi:hypothetical protein
MGTSQVEKQSVKGPRSPQSIKQSSRRSETQLVADSVMYPEVLAAAAERRG